MPVLKSLHLEFLVNFLLSDSFSFSLWHFPLCLASDINVWILYFWLPLETKGFFFLLFFFGILHTLLLPRWIFISSLCYPCFELANTYKLHETQREEERSYWTDSPINIRITCVSGFLLILDKEWNITSGQILYFLLRYIQV